MLSWFEDWSGGNPKVLWIPALFLVLLVCVWVLVRRRNRQKQTP